jgi:excisionase family DNA binding protein
MTTENYVTITDLAKFFNVSVSTVRSWIRTGVLTSNDYLKVGNTYRFKMADVDAALRRAPPDAVAPPTKTSDSRQLELDLNPDDDI